MKILIVGCSVVRGAYIETPSWAEMVKQDTKHEVDMITSNGMGNEYISHMILQNIKNYDAFITVWSPADARDICYSDRKKVKLFSSSGCTSKEKDNLIDALKNYCELDTLAMVMLFEHLNFLVQK